MTAATKKMASGFKMDNGMAEPTVSAGYAKALMDLAVSKGADQQQLIERSHINLNDLQDQDSRIPLENHIALMKAGKELSNEPALSLHFGELSDMPQMSIVGLICQAADTMAEAFTQMNRYGRLVIEVDLGRPTDRFEIIRSNGQMWLVDARKNPNSYPELTESTFARMICWVGQKFGDKPFAKAVHVTHAEPSYRAEYDRIFKMPVVFGSDKNALLIDETWLSIKIPPSSRYVFGILSEHADGLLESLKNSNTMKGKVESLLIPILHTGEFRMKSIAKKLGLSQQTLYRKLKAEDVSYEKLLDELRHKMALHYLSGEKVSVNETAYLVGFSDPSAFSRAFKRWTGKTPGKV